MSGFECAQCHEVFGSLALFDDHQDVNYKLDPPVYCRNPQSLGLAQTPGGIWTMPEYVKSRQAAASRLAAARSLKASRNA